jgi:hypothetical protein
MGTFLSIIIFRPLNIMRLMLTQLSAIYKRLSYVKPISFRIKPSNNFGVYIIIIIIFTSLLFKVIVHFTFICILKQ